LPFLDNPERVNAISPNDSGYRIVQSSASRGDNWIGFLDFSFEESKDGLNGKSRVGQD
jgi:hypothetical protein